MSLFEDRNDFFVSIGFSLRFMRLCVVYVAFYYL